MVPLGLGLEGGFGIGVGNPSAGVFGRTVPAGPDIVRHLGYRRDTKNGVMWVHGSKGNSCLCQTVAGAARLLFRSGTGGTGGTVRDWDFLFTTWCLEKLRTM